MMAFSHMHTWNNDLLYMVFHHDAYRNHERFKRKAKGESLNRPLMVKNRNRRVAAYLTKVEVTNYLSENRPTYLNCVRWW